MKISRFLFFAIFCCQVLLLAQDEKLDLLAARLAGHGFENLRIATSSDSGLAIAFDNRIYRHDLKAAGEILAVVSKEDSTWSRIRLIPCSRGVARGEISVSGDDYRLFMAGQMDVGTFAKTIEVGEAREEPKQRVSAWKNKAFFKVDANINFGTQLQMGQYDDRLKFYGELQPGLRTQLWLGTMAQAEAFIPLFDEIGVYDTGARLGRASLSQLFRLPHDTYAVLNGGVFVPDRWGLSGEAVKFWLHRCILTGVKVDNSGFFYHDQGTWYYSTMNLWTYRIYGQYYLPWTDMMVGIDYSKYLLGDKGWCFTLRRTFSETDISVYVAKTDYDRFGGVLFRIPLPTQRRMYPHRFRVTWPLQYGWGYQATSEATRTEGILQTGLAIDTGFSMTEFVRHLTPTHVRSSVAGWRKIDD